MPYGTLATIDTLASTQQTVAQFGEDNAFQAIDAARQAHNARMREMMGALAEVTTERLRRYGGPDAMTFDEIDEFGTPDAQKVTAGSNVGFPLRMYGRSVQWTRKYLQNATVSELTAQFTAAQDADIRNVDLAIRRAIFLPTNVSFVDRLIDQVVLPVKALVNADSAPLPLAPDGSTFNAATHTHYLARAGGSVVAADIDALINTVAEHYAVGQVMVYINRDFETTMRGFTAAGQFVGYQPVQVIPAENTVRATANLDTRQLYNRAIGTWGNSGAEIWVKPWIPSGYAFAWVMGGPKPLAFRERTAGSGDLELLYEDEIHPLRARGIGREFGMGAYNRTNGAVLYLGGTTYTAPTLNA